MCRFKEIEHDESNLKRLTGLRTSEFLNLHKRFNYLWQDYFEKFTLEGQPRKRVSSVRTNSIFPDTADALLFGLMYIKNRTLQEQLAIDFGIDQPKASRYLKLIGKLIYQTVETYKRSLSPKKREWLLNELSKQ